MSSGPRHVSADLTGYCDRLSYRPGDTVALHAHGSSPTRMDVVHLAPPLVGTAGEGEPVPGIAAVDRLLVPQVSHPGSFGLVEGLESTEIPTAITVSAWIWPTMPSSAAVQGILSLTLGRVGGFIVALTNGHVAILRTGAGRGEVVKIAAPVLERQWTRIEATLAVASSHCTLKQETHLPFPSGIGGGAARADFPGLQGTLGVGGLVIGACSCHVGSNGALYGESTFNGKIEAVCILADTDAGQEVLGQWDFSRDMGTNQIRDVSGNARDGIVVNAPTRAVTGRRWTGDEVDFRRAPLEYAAIHFHDDDLEDAAWDVAAQFVLPESMASGAYAVRLRSGAAEDHVPFFVVPLDGGPRQQVAFLASTFNYLAYANAGIHDRFDYSGSGMSGRTLQPGDRDRQRMAHPAVGGSLYDLHSDGSGRSTSSSLRPIFTLRADWQSALQQAPRHLGADLFTIAWLRRREFGHDVLTDHWLDDDGADLSGYRALVTSSHPEYWSGGMLSRLEAFIAGGGRVMYLGGNGFYWVTARDQARPHLIECRRGHAGVRAWSSEPGEVHLSLTGEMGGLWRHRGRAPNRLVGIGMAGQGTDLKSPGYAITAVGREEKYAWMFEGVEGDVFGEAGFAMGGAAGDEVDRYDVRLGSPPQARVVATSQKLGRYYKVAIEDVEMIADDLDGETDPRVRADVVIFDWAGGGVVFSTGSIAWAAALAWNGFDNDVERVTRNVLTRFLSL